MKSFVWVYSPEENPDWDYARNKQFLIRTDRASFSQSLFSVEMGKFIAPNRDYHHQGFSLHLPRSNWKFLDSIAIADERKGFQNLVAKHVIVEPFAATYVYKGQGIEIRSRYTLMNSKSNSAALLLNLKIKTDDSKKRFIHVKPFIDIRDLNAESSVAYEIELDGENLLVHQGNKGIYFSSDAESSVKILSSAEEINWDYKLGSGFRKEENGTRFIHEQRKITALFEMLFPVKGEKNMTIIISSGFLPELKKDHDYCLRHYKENERKLRLRMQRIATAFKGSPELIARIMTLSSFLQYPEELMDAGDFWFNQVWYRDLLEALLNNMEVLSRVSGRSITRILKHCASVQDISTGLIPTVGNDYGSTDAVLLYLIAFSKWLNKKWSNEMARLMLRSARILLNAFTSERNRKIGAPYVDAGLLYANPASSWTDSIVDGRSTRVPEHWGNPQYVLLPEINAQWILSLKGISEIAERYGDFELKEVASKMLASALIKYKKIFHNINTNFPYNAVLNVKRDPTITSMGLVSAVMLHKLVYSSNDLKRMWPSVKRILVFRKKQPFGVLVKEGKKAYYGDREYHDSVIWPRDSPYLVKYFRIIGREDEANAVLENAIDHQMSEGCILYNHELFSLPIGNNPRPTHESENPVPVKNPAQLWSHWCDVFLQ